MFRKAARRGSVTCASDAAFKSLSSSSGRFRSVARICWAQRGPILGHVSLKAVCHLHWVGNMNIAARLIYVDSHTAPQTVQHNHASPSTRSIADLGTHKHFGDCVMAVERVHCSAAALHSRDPCKPWHSR